MLIKKEKLLIIAGAGASIPFGNYSCADIDNMFKENGIIELNTSPEPMTLYKYCSEEINKFIANRTYHDMSQFEQKLTNFEQVIYEMLNIYALTQESHNRTTGAFFQKKVFPQKNIFPEGHKELEPYDFIRESENLISILAKNMRQRNLKFKNHSLFPNFQAFCSLLKMEYDIGILNFNYDDIFEEGFSSALNTGFDKKGKFDPMRIVNGKWNFLYYPHGSLHFDISYHDNIDEYHYEKDINKLIISSPAIQPYDRTIEGFPILRTPIIVGHAKAYQTQRNPFSLYINDFAKKVYEADKILFIGYGFNDIYINNIIRLSMNHNKNRKILIIDYTKNNQRRKYIEKIKRNLCEPYSLVTDDFDINDFLEDDYFYHLKLAGISFSAYFQGFEPFIENPQKLLTELK